MLFDFLISNYHKNINQITIKTKFQHMKNLILSFVAILAISFSTNAQEFEGIVNIKHNSKHASDVKITKKGDNSLMETSTAEGDLQLLYNTNTEDMIAVTIKDGEKMGVKTNNNNNPYLKQMQHMQRYNDRSKEKDVKITVTTDKKNIRGYECVKVLGEDEEGKGYAWVATSLNLTLSDLMPLAKTYLGGQDPMQRLSGIEGFVMELHMTDKKTGEEIIMENEVIEKKIDDSVFSSVTEGVDILDTSNMQQMIQEASKDPKKMEQFKEMMKRYQKGN